MEENTSVKGNNSDKDTSIFSTVVEFLQENNLSFQQIKENECLVLGVEVKNGRFTCHVIVREEKKQMAFYSICPINTPESKRQSIAEFITKANYGMIIGNFELDFKDGEIRYKTSIDVEGDRLTPALIKQLVFSNIAMMDQYLPGIMSVIYGNASPDEAISQVED